MAIAIRKISGHRYAYRVAREDGRLAQTYLGRADDPGVRKLLAREDAAKEIPETVRSLFWETLPSRLDCRKHGAAIIRKVLEYGDLVALEWLQRRFGIRRIEDAVLSGRGLSPRTRAFYAVWFGIEGVE